MSALKLSEQFDSLSALAAKLYQTVEAEALLVLVERPVDWQQLKKTVGPGVKILIVGDTEDDLRGADEADLDTLVLNVPEASVFDKLTQALLGAVANEQLPPGAEVVALYSGFEAGRVDSLSCIRLDEHLGRLTARDLRKLETKVPLETLKTVVDLAVEIGREGREGKPVGTVFVVGDSRSVMRSSEPLGFDPVKGYNRSERNIQDDRDARSDQENRTVGRGNHCGIRRNGPGRLSLPKCNRGQCHSLQRARRPSLGRRRDHQKDQSRRRDR